MRALVKISIWPGLQERSGQPKSETAGGLDKAEHIAWVNGFIVAL